MSVVSSTIVLPDQWNGLDLIVTGRIDEWHLNCAAKVDSPLDPMTGTPIPQLSVTLHLADGQVITASAAPVARWARRFYAWVKGFPL